MFNRNIPPVLLNIIIINVIFFLATLAAPYLQIDMIRIFALFYPLSDEFKPWQIITYMFMHGGFLHLLFNMLALFFFGADLENTWGPKRMLWFYFLTGIGAAAFHFGLNTIMLNMGSQSVSLGPLIGASGAVFGITTAYGFMFPDRLIYSIFIPTGIKAKWMTLIYLAIEFFTIIGNNNDNIAHLAHLGGAATGIIILFIWKARKKLY